MKAQFFSIREQMNSSVALLNDQFGQVEASLTPAEEPKTETAPAAESAEETEYDDVAQAVYADAEVEEEFEEVEDEEEFEEIEDEDDESEVSSMGFSFAEELEDSEEYDNFTIEGFDSMGSDNISKTGTVYEVVDDIDEDEDDEDSDAESFFRGFFKKK